MNARERLNMTLNHQEPDKVVVDLGSSVVTGIAAGALSRLRDALGLEKRLVKVYEPMQLLGEVEEDVREALGIDVAGVCPNIVNFGYENKDWKPWHLADGTEVLVGGGFTTTVDEKGDTYIYPQGDLKARPSGMMPKGGWYFDQMVRQEPYDEDKLDAKAAREDFKDDFGLLKDETLRYMENLSSYYYDNTEYGINLGNFYATFGDVAFIPGVGLKVTKGVRSAEDWLVTHYTAPEYIKEVYQMHSEAALKNLGMLWEAIGKKAQVIQLSGTDFGTQRSEYISPDMYREFYKPLHKKVNDWVHSKTTWKTMYHSCGAITNFLDDFVEAGVDIVNPVQCSAACMDPKWLKETYGKKLVFWGAGMDTQKILPFGTPEEVHEHVLERLEIFAPGGGFVFNAIHNIQANVPVQNIITAFNAVKEYNNRKR